MPRGDADGSHTTVLLREAVDALVTDVDGHRIIIMQLHAAD